MTTETIQLKVSGTMSGNVVVAVLFNIVGMILAAMGSITPSLAILVMILSIFAILLNTLRVRGIDLEREETAESGPLVEVEFLVPNMVCEGCAEKVRTSLETVQGVREIKTKVPSMHVVVRYEPTKVREEQLKGVVTKAGFTAVEA